MKNFSLPFVFLLSSFVVNAQSWMPFQPEESYSYSYQNAPYVTQVIKTEDRVAVAGDTLFFIGSVVDTSDLPLVIYGTKQAYNLPVAHEQFPGHYYRKTADTVWFYSLDSSEVKYVFPLRLQVNDSWVFSRGENDTATVIYSGVQPALGQTDSVRIIVRHQGADTMVISKNHGLVVFQNQGGQYMLRGLHKAHLGDYAPGLLDIYDFNPGDVLVYQAKIEEAMKGHEELNYTWKYRILSKTTGSNSITYQAQIFEIKQYTDWSNLTGYTQYAPMKVDTGTVSESQPYLFQNPPVLFTHPGQLFQGQGFLTWARTGSDSLGFYYYGEDNYVSAGTAVTGYDSLFLDSELIILSWPAHHFIKVRPHLGVTSAGNAKFEYADSWQLIGAVINGDTTGTIPSDSYMLGLKDDGEQLPPVVFPNPVQDILTIDPGQTPVVRFILRDVNGRVWKKQKATGHGRIKTDIRDCPRGVYFLEMETKDKRLIVSKVVKI